MEEKNQQQRRRREEIALVGWMEFFLGIFFVVLRFYFWEEKEISEFLGCRPCRVW
jgi:hypothetical protein